MRPEAAVFPGRCILERSAINVSDAQANPSPQSRERARLRGFRAHLSVPMLRDGRPNGVISVSRREAGAFAANEVQLLQTFADQAVIAIENVRLFNETQGSAGAADRHRRHPEGDRQLAVGRPAGVRSDRDQRQRLLGEPSARGKTCHRRTSSIWALRHSTECGRQSRRAIPVPDRRLGFRRRGPARSCR